MNEPIEYKLINGTFTVQEAREVLLDLLNKKIHFHQLKNFSSEERLGKPNHASLKRIKELERDKADLLTQLELASLCQYDIRIYSSVVIEFCKQPIDVQRQKASDSL
jgi:hypothetical protein